MRPEVIHEEIVRVVHEEMQSIHHLFVVSHKRHLQVLVNHLLQLGLCLVLLMDELDLPLLLGFLE